MSFKSASQRGAFFAALKKKQGMQNSSSLIPKLQQMMPKEIPDAQKEIDPSKIMPEKPLKFNKLKKLIKPPKY